MSIPRVALIGAAALVCAAVSSCLAAATSATLSTSRPSVALEKAIHAVWRNSPELEAARTQLDAARADARADAQPLYNPEFSVETERADVNRRVAGLSLTLDLSGKRRARAGRGEARLRAATARFAQLRRDLSARWLNAWSRLAFAERQREIGQRRLELMKRFDALAARRLTVGDISSPERDLAGLALGEAQAQQAELVGNEAVARAALAGIVNEALIKAPPLPETLPPAAASVSVQAIGVLPEMQLAAARESTAEAEEQMARRARIPDPTVSLTGGRVRNGPFQDRVIGLSVSIPLPILNTGSAEVAAARARALAEADQLRAQRLRVKARLRENRVRYASLRASAQAFERSRAAAYEERAELLERLWRAGEIDTSDYLVQLKQSLDTALSGLRLQSQAWRAWFDYLASAGRLTDWLDRADQEISE